MMGEAGIDIDFLSDSDEKLNDFPAGYTTTDCRMAAFRLARVAEKNDWRELVEEEGSGEVDAEVEGIGLRERVASAGESASTGDST